MKKIFLWGQPQPQPQPHPHSQPQQQPQPNILPDWISVIRALPPGGGLGGFAPQESPLPMPCPRSGCALPPCLAPNSFSSVFFPSNFFRPIFFRPSSVVARILNPATHWQPLAWWSEKSRHATDSVHLWKHPKTIEKVQKHSKHARKVSKKSKKLKTSERFQTLPITSERIQDVPKCIRIGLNRPKHVNKAPKTFENLQKILRSARPAEVATNFERPFTPRTAPIAAKLRQRTFQTICQFDFLTPNLFFLKFFILMDGHLK